MTPGASQNEATSRAPSARIEPLPDEDADDEQRELLVTAPMAQRAPNFFRVLVRSPSAYRGLVAGYGRNDAVPSRDYELMALRTAWRCQCEYIFAQHSKKSTGLGVVSDHEVDAVVTGPGAPEWAPWEANLLRAVDELHDEACITDATWAILAERYDERQLVEVPMIVGGYHNLAFAMNSYGVQLEPGAQGFPAV
ncbi:MAG: carboxymuconolactone decarboxylase [Actinomycetia bacterium]|nr:carboxymuconolactone decarboxylase [Actinomycetes bacterium]